MCVVLVHSQVPHIDPDQVREQQRNHGERNIFYILHIASCILHFVFFLKCLNLPADQLPARSVDHVDIAFDDLSSDKHYKEEEDPKKFKSTKTSNTN